MCRTIHIALKTSTALCGNKPILTGWGGQKASLLSEQNGVVSNNFEQFNKTASGALCDAIWRKDFYRKTVDLPRSSCIDSPCVTGNGMSESNESAANGSESAGSENSNGALVVTLTPEDAARLAGEDPLADKVWRLAASGVSMRAIGKMFGKSHVWAWRIVTERTKELQDISSVEHKAANRAIVLDRYDWAAKKCAEFIENYDPDADKNLSIPALLAVYVKCAENRAKVTGVCGEMDVAAVVDVNRLSEVARRIMLAGPHSKAARMASRQAMDMAGVKEADAVEVKPSPES